MDSAAQIKPLAQVSELEGLGNSLTNTNESYSVLLERMEKAINRIAGAHPAEVAKGTADIPTSSHIASIRSGINDLDRKSARFSGLVERLESIG